MPHKTNVFSMCAEEYIYVSINVCPIFNFPIVSRFSMPCTSRILKKVPVWSEKQNYPTFGLCSFFTFGLKGGEPGLLLKAATSWQGSVSRSTVGNDYAR